MTETFAPLDRARFETAIKRFDEENSRDPNLISQDGVRAPRELAYSQWLTDWVLRLKPDASEAMRLAARGAHLCRWLISRNTYPKTRVGYLRWRQDLKKFHSNKVREILQEIGYAEDIVSRVQQLVSKSSSPSDEESQILEDALCLVFLEHQFGDLARRSSDDKMINALQKSWKKMSPAARSIAATLPYSEGEKALLNRALGG